MTAHLLSSQHTADATLSSASRGVRATCSRVLLVAQVAFEVDKKKQRARAGGRGSADEDAPPEQQEAGV